MQTPLPVIRIQDAWLLREHASRYLRELRGGGDLPDNDWMAGQVGAYRRAWRPHEQQILRAMTGALGLAFRQNIIDVYIAPEFEAFSDPLVIGVGLEPDEFVDALTHELLHRLLTDNTAVPFERRLRSEWERLFGKRPYGELVHIAVFALHKAIYLDALGEPGRLERNIAESKASEHKEYGDAWDYVNAHGYREIIARLRDSYQNIS